ncbi:MAG: hypothetical protein JW855_06015 [Gammaproteobacteria bacterium]|nr:hypothetical protein [Gammaproteobacteria bacterium]
MSFDLLPIDPCSFYMFFGGSYSNQNHKPKEKIKIIDSKAKDSQLRKSTHSIKNTQFGYKYI